jgi:tetratricopeptide (TPR) repeat protein
MRLPRWQIILVGCLGIVGASPLVAQRQEFTQQTLMVAPLHFGDAVSGRSARQVAASLRSAISRLSNRRELFVVGTDTVEILLERAGFKYDTVIDEAMTLVLAQQMRADEVIVGSVANRDGLIEARTELALMRDWRLRQPLPVVRGRSVRSVVDTLAAAIVRARQQMPGLRRCENAARSGNPQLALKSAEEAISLYPASTLARTCLTMVLRYNDIGADVIARASEELLNIEPRNIIAAVLRANALSSLERRDSAAAAWEHIVSLRPDSLALATAAADELMRLQQPTAVVRVTGKLLSVHEGDLPLRRLRFRAQIALSAWPDAAALGDSLTVVDDEFDTDSSYTARHIEALRLSGDTLLALARSARAVKQHSGDLSLYLQYLSLVNAEHTTALPRGIVRFPESSELNVLAAREAVAAGRRQAAIASLGSAVRQDPLLMQGFLQIAELWFEEEQPDSAVSAILRAPRSTNPDLLRAYAVSRGRQMLRGASDTAVVVWQRAHRLFALADSLDSQDDSRSLIAAVTLSVARAELVAAIPAKSCAGAERADSALVLSAGVLDRSAGNGRTDPAMSEAFNALRTSTDDAKRVFCNGRPPN